MEALQQRVLFVDDEAAILNVMKRVFRLEPYDIRFASDGSEALRVFEEFQPAVIVSDHRMPGMTGTELLAQIRERDPETVRIILTGHTDLAVAEAAINSGEVYRFLTKPWNDDELRAAVASGLETHRLREERARLIERLEELNETLEGRLVEKTEELEATTDELERARPLADLGLLAGGIAHELNNPLGGLLAITQLKLADAEAGTQDEEDLKFIEEAALRCKAIVADLMSLAAPHRNSERMPQRIEAVIERALQVLASDSRKTRVPIERQYDPHAPSVVVNADQITRIIMNVVANAVQAADRDGGLIRIQTRAENGTVTVSIEDNGPGIPKDVQGKVFKPFFTTRPVGQGAGLGLSVAQALARANRGKLVLACADPGATRFDLELQAAAEEGDHE